MSDIIWDESLAINIPLIDSQHKQLIEMINELSQAIDQKKSHEILDSLFARLITYTQTHFAAEEELMKIINYNRLDIHKSMHAHFTQKVLSRYREYKVGKKAVDKAVLDMLINWLLTHIKTADNKLRGQIELQQKAKAIAGISSQR
jgi:hemerythrin